MKNYFPVPSSTKGPNATSNEHAVNESMGRKKPERRSIVGESLANRKPAVLAEEERQDVSLGNEAGQQSQDDMEYELLCQEIDRINQRLQSGAIEAEEKITLTSTLSKDAEISQAMHEKLMRLIKAMIPNSTTEQKDSFIRDLFEMGLRVNSNSSVRVQMEERLSAEKESQPSLDDFMIDASNSILASSNENSMRQKPNRIVNPYLDEGLKNSPSLDDYIDGANSIIASMDEYDAPGVEMASSLHQSLSSRRYLASQPTNSSEAVDFKWEQLRNKMLNESSSGRTKNSLASEKESDLIEECVETSLMPYRARIDTKLESVPKRPGQEDESSIDQPTQQRNVSLDRVSIVEIPQNAECESESFDDCSMRKNSPEKRVHTTEQKIPDSIGAKTIATQKQLTDDSNPSEPKMEESGISEGCENTNHISMKLSQKSISVTLSSGEEAHRSFYKAINLSANEPFKISDDDEAEVLPTWRLSPQESLSDFTLTILSSETGSETNYYVHKHMMAIGPRSSQYLCEVFAAENTSHFQVTLDGKTSPLIPAILDFMYCQDHEISMTTENAVAFRQLAKMLKISPLEVNAANFILKDIGIHNLVTYVSECAYFNDIEVTKAALEKCIAKIESISIHDRLWIVMEPELFLQVVSSPHVDRGVLSKHLSILLKEYLDLHQYEITEDLFLALTSENIIPIVDRSAALPLIELCEIYNSDQCEELQKRCAFTIACYWQTTPQAERHRLFSLMRHLPSSITVDFLEIVESGQSTLEMLRSEMEQKTIEGNLNAVQKQQPMTIEDFCCDLDEENQKKEKLSWRVDPRKSYSDMAIRVVYLNHDGSQLYYVHKQIVAVGPNRSTYLAQHLNSGEFAPGEEAIIQITLDYEASVVVPQVLDFLYSDDTTIDISSKNSVALHYISRAFGISRLSREIRKFIDHDLSLENIVEYIADGGHYRDRSTIATAGRLCAHEITSIGVDSDLLKELDPYFLDKVVSSDIIEKRTRPYVNVLITKYIAMHRLEGHLVEKLLESIDINEIDKTSALALLKTVVELRDYNGIETFQKMKEKSIDIITEFWSEITSDDHRRQDIFSLMPSLPSNLIASMFEIVDGKAKKAQMEVASKQTMLENICHEQVAEANRLRKLEVSRLKKELETQARAMLSLQMDLEDQMGYTNKVVVRPTASNGAIIPKSPTKQKKIQFSEYQDGEYEPAYELEGEWYSNQDGENGLYDKLNPDEMEMIAEVFDNNPGAFENVSAMYTHTHDKYDNGRKAEDEDDLICDQQSVCTARVQKKKGRTLCW